MTVMFARALGKNQEKYAPVPHPGLCPSQTAYVPATTSWMGLCVRPAIRFAMDVAAHLPHVWLAPLRLQDHFQPALLLQAAHRANTLGLVRVCPAIAPVKSALQRRHALNAILAGT